jgi:hypothetical protein
MDSLELVCPQISVSKKSIEEINCARACILFLVIVLGISSSYDRACITFHVIVQELVVVVTMLALRFLSVCWELVITAF